MTRTMGAQVMGLKGLKIVLNSSEPHISGFSSGYTLPSCLLKNQWTSFDGYLSHLRSHYRYRINKALGKWNNVQCTRLTNNHNFTTEMHQLYLDVHARSNAKIEQLSIEFFRQFPGELYTFCHSKHLLGFVQLYQESNRLIFMFTGINYEKLKQYDIYFNLLIWILKLGISKGCGIIDLGQTGEEIKLKLGCEMEEKFLHVHHSNRIVNKLIQFVMPLVSYRMPKFSFKVFRDRLT